MTHKDTTMMYEKKNITKVVVGLPPKGLDNTLKVIIDPQQLSEIVKYVNYQVKYEEGWVRTDSAITTTSFIKLYFYEKDIYRGNFGYRCGDEIFFDASDDRGYRKKNITVVEGELFLKLIGVTKEQYDHLLTDYNRPGPWKNRN